MHFLSDAIAEIEGLLEVNRDFCKKQMAEIEGLLEVNRDFCKKQMAEIEGLLEVNRDFCKKQMAEKASPALPTNCAVVPLMLQRVSPLRRRGGGFPLAPSTPSGCTPMFLGFYRKFYGSFPIVFPTNTINL